nr:PAS domain S-box protein [Spirochaetota bacterium]
MNNNTSHTGSAEHFSMNEMFYRRLIEASPDPIYIYVNETIVFANVAAAKLLGSDNTGTIIGRSVWDFVPLSSRPALEKGIELIINRERQYILADDMVKRLDGRVLNVEISSSFFRFNGQPGILAFFRDITKRYKAEEQLRKSENVYRTIFETTGTAMIFIEEDTTISLMNSESLKLSGYTKEEVEGRMSWMDFVSGGDLPRLRQYHDLRTINPELVPRNYEFMLKDRNGQLRDVFMTIALIPETKQRVASIVDISDRKHAERALAASEEKYRLVVENAKEAIVIIQDDVIKYVNPKVCDITGYSESRLLGRDFFAYIHPDSREYVEAEYQRRLENEAGRSIGPIKVFDTEREVRWLEIYSVHIRWEDKKAVLLFLTDITDRKAAEEALAASEAKYRVLAENAGDIIIICDMEGVITYINRTGCEITGMTIDDIRGRNINDLIQPGKNVSLKNSIIEKKINDSNVYRHKAQIENR